MCSQRPAHKQKNTIGSHAHWPGPVPILRVLAPTLPPPFLVRASSPITPGPALLSPRSPAPSPSSPSLFPSCPALPLYPISSGHSTHVAHSAPSPHLAHLPLSVPFPTSRIYRPNSCGRNRTDRIPLCPYTQSRHAHEQNANGSHAYWPRPVPKLRVLASTLPPPPLPFGLSHLSHHTRFRLALPLFSRSIPFFSLPRPILPCSRTLPYFQRTLYTRSSHSAPSPHLAHLPLRSPFPTSRHYRPTHAGEPDGQNTSRPTHTVSARFAVDPSPLSSQSPSRLTARTVAPWRER